MNYKLIFRCFEKLNIRILIGFALLCILSIASVIINISLHYNHKDNTDSINVDINTEYNEEDLNDIEEVRNLFSVYLKSAEYDKFGIPEIDLTDQYNNRTSHIIESAQCLLAKYGRIQIDSDTFLSFDDKSRYITIVNGICTFATDVSVDVPVESNYYLFRESFVPTRSGTWCVYPSSLDDKFLFFEFGNEIHSSAIKADCALEMLDIRFINSSYLNHNEENPYKINSNYYLFKNISNKIYIYNVHQKTWLSIPEEIMDIKLTDEFVSLITTNNIFYMYCIKDSSLFKVGKTEESLCLRDRAYLPDEYNMEDIEKLHRCKK